MRTFFISFFTLWTATFLGQSNIDVSHYDLQLILSPDEKQITVIEALQIRLLAPTSELKLDLIGPQDRKSVV